MSKGSIIASIRSLIAIDTFFENWENVALWKEQLAEAETTEI